MYNYEERVPEPPREKYRVRSLFSPTRVFDNFDEAWMYHDDLLSSNDYDLVYVEQETDTGWELIEIEEE